MLGNWFAYRGGGQRQAELLLPAIERAVSIVEPLLKQMAGYPDQYRKPVAAALEYAHALAASVPGPVIVDRGSYANDAFVHALFPGIDTIADAFRSSQALQEYQRRFPDHDELYALMGMRRVEKQVVGMALSGQTVQRDVIQQAVYFIGHTIDHPASSEQQSRELIAMSFFDSLMGKVKSRIEQRKQERQVQLQEKDRLQAQLHTANGLESRVLQEQLDETVFALQATVNLLELDRYVADFDAVLFHAEQYLRLQQTSITLDNMGIRQASGDAGQGLGILFSDLVGYDRRNWTVTMVHCRQVSLESFAEKLDQAYRRLVI